MARKKTTPEPDKRVPLWDRVGTTPPPVRPPRGAEIPAEAPGTPLATPPDAETAPKTPDDPDRYAYEVEKPAPKTALGAKIASALRPKTAHPPHLIVEARAGTGKTTTLVEGLKLMRGELPSIKPSPQQQAVWDQMVLSRDAQTLCFVAFNVSIADELKRRVPQGVDAMTMNSLGNRAVTKAFGRQEPTNYANRDRLAEVLNVDDRVLQRTRPGLVSAVDELVTLCKQNLVGYGTVVPKFDIDFQLDYLAAHYGVEIEDKDRIEVYQLVPEVLEASKTPKGKITFADQIWLPIVLNLPLFRYDVLLVDECVPGWTPVMLADGRSLTIKDIVESDEDFRVRAYDTETGIGRNCRVVGKQKLLNQKPLVKIKAKHFHKTGTNRKCNFVICTINHKLWTINRGWIAAGEIRVGDDVVIETAAKTTQKGKVTKQGRDTLAELQLGNKRGVGNIGGDPAMFNRVKGGNGRGPSFAEKTLLDALNIAYPDGTWAFSHVVKTGDAPQHGRGNRPSHYKVDIANEGERIAIEVDGQSHRGNEAVDKKKTDTLEEQGWVVVRVSNREAIQKTPEIVDRILAISNSTPCEGENCPRPARVVSVDSVEIPDSYVYDITVEDCHNFYANGVLVHNCQDLNRCQQALAKRAGHRLILVGDPRQAIYGFAGADSESMKRMTIELDQTKVDDSGDGCGCVVLPLTVTRRCGRAIVEEARKIVPDFSAHESNCAGSIRRRGYDEKSVYCDQTTGSTVNKTTYHGFVEDGDMILCRVNAPLVSQCFKFIKMGRKATIRGRDIAKGLTTTVNKMRAISVQDLVTRLSDWANAETTKEQAKRNPSENRLIAIRDRVDCLFCFCDGAQSVTDVLSKIDKIFVDNASEGILLSSIHKAKGLEAKRVFILMPKGAEMPHPMAKSTWQREQEQNLIYVARTRAIEELVYVC